jgi:peptidoglycan-associated lipoprotein
MMSNTQTPVTSVSLMFHPQIRTSASGAFMTHPLLSRLAVLATALVLAACAQQVKLDETAPVDARSGAAPGAGGSGANATGIGAGGTGGSGLGSERPVAQVNVDPLNDPNSPLAKRSVYFDFDSFVIRDEFRGTVEAHARYLQANRNRKVIVQGNTDERGSREYNLALGQKRAEAVRRALNALGVSDNQIEAVSLGEEKPRGSGNDESTWAENRRADLVYQ